MSNVFDKAIPEDLKRYIFDNVNFQLNQTRCMDPSYTSQKITSALLADEQIEINWSKTPVKVQNHTGESFLIRHYPPVELSTSDFHKVLNKVRDEYDQAFVIGTVGNFIVKDEPEITIIEMKCLAYMLSELYQKMCLT